MLNIGPHEWEAALQYQIERRAEQYNDIEV